MAKALYRKYRPKTLVDVVGQDQVVSFLSRALAENKISHAYLFVGPRGTGKTSVARIFAHEINDFPYEIEDDYVDIIEIDGASNRGIDDIRELREKAAIAPTTGKYKVYIIDEVHMLTREAFNALLKTLEEPPKHTIFIMATTDAHKVPVTITSRAQTYTFRLADHAVMFDFLRNVANKENIKITDDAIKLIVKRGGGSFRDSLSILDQISTLSSREISREMVEAAMGLPDDEKIDQILEDYLSGDVVKITTDFKEILSNGIKPETLNEEIVARIIEKPTPEILPLLGKLAEIRPPFVEAKLLVAFTKPEIIPKIATENSQPTENSQSTENSQPTENSQSTKKPKPVIKPEPLKNSENFDMENFLKQIRVLNGGKTWMPIKNVHFEIIDGDLHVSTTSKSTRSILVREQTKEMLAKASGGLKIVIEDIGTIDSQRKMKDATILKMSDIMGGEVENDRGGSPF